MDMLYLKLFVVNREDLYDRHELDHETLYCRLIKDCSILFGIRRALFGEPASEPAKVEVECPNCGGEVDRTRRTLDHLHPDSDKHGFGTVYVCKPAQPEPSFDDQVRAAVRAESPMFKQPEPVAAEADDPEELRVVGNYLREACDSYVTDGTIGAPLNFNLGAVYARYDEAILLVHLLLSVVAAENAEGQYYYLIDRAEAFLAAETKGSE